MRFSFLRRALFFIIVLVSLAGAILPDAAVLAACNPNAAVTLVSASLNGGASDQGVHQATPAISGDGRYIAYASSSSNLVHGDTNGTEDVFVYDRLRCTTRRVSVSSSGQQVNANSEAPVISNDGRYVAFMSDLPLSPQPTNGNWNIYVRDLVANRTTLVSVRYDGDVSDSSRIAWFPAISGNGRYIAFESDAPNLVPDDTNQALDVFVYDRQTGQMSLASVASDGTQANSASGNPLISGDGSIVAFESNATNLTPTDLNGNGGIFIHNMQTGETTLATVNSSGVAANRGSQLTGLSGDGNSVVFQTTADNLIDPNTFLCSRNIDPNCLNLYIYHADTHQTTQAVLGYNSAQPQPNGSTGQGTISADGRILVFSSIATNLAPGRTGDGYDLFSGDHPGLNLPITDKLNPIINEGEYPAISSDGHYMAFLSGDDNPPGGDINNVPDVFVVPVPTIDYSEAPTRNYFTTGTVTVTWNAANGATGYEIEVAHDATFRQMVDHQTDLTADTLAITEHGLTDGVYFWRVRAQHSSGSPSAWSVTESFTVKTT